MSEPAFTGEAGLAVLVIDRLGATHSIEVPVDEPAFVFAASRLNPDGINPKGPHVALTGRTDDARSEQLTTYVNGLETINVGPGAVH